MNLVPLKKYLKNPPANPTYYTTILVDSDQNVFSCSPADNAACELKKMLRDNELKNRIILRLSQYDLGGINDLKGSDFNGKTIFHQSETVGDGSLSFFFRLYGLNLANQQQLEDVTELQKDNNEACELKVKIGDDTVNYCTVDQISLKFQDSHEVNYQLRIELLGIGEHIGETSYSFFVYNRNYFPKGTFSL